MPSLLTRLLLQSFVVSLLMLSASAFSQTSAAAKTPADVRLVIDISGSMKQTDPQNLRVPALKLLVKLLPQGARAGVWSFGRDVNMLIPYGPVDAKWQVKALAKAANINSVGLFTNIGEALEKATQVPAHGDNASVILLTDGKVDINKAAAANTRERERILTSLLPQLKKRGFSLHTIALSNDADKSLLQQLSRTTDGSFNIANSADDLLQTFLHIFDQAVPAKRLPLVDNRFLVDKSVDEFTALIFHTPKAEATTLKTPAGKIITAQQHGENIKWYSADNYDLMTVTDPIEGQWQVNAEQTPQNRVTVVSDLQLEVDPLPNNVVAGQQLPLQFGLYEKGHIITDPNFTQLLTPSVTVHKLHSQARWQVSLNDNKLPKSGKFTRKLPAFTERGQYLLTVIVDGKTFAREYKHRINVNSSFAVRLKKQGLGKAAQYQITVTTDPTMVDVKRLAVVAHIKASTGNSELRTLKSTAPGVWHMLIVPKEFARYVVKLSVGGQDDTGKSYQEKLPSQFFTYPAEADPIVVPDDKVILALRKKLAAEQKALSRAKQMPDEPVKHPSANASARSSSSVAKKVEKKTASESKTSGTNAWLMAGIILLNVLFLGGLAYWAYRKFSPRDVSEELDELEQKDDAAESEGKGTAQAESVALDDESIMAELEPEEGAQDGELPVDNKDREP